MRALVLDAEQQIATVQNVPIPEPGPKELLIKVHAIALNPVDALYTFHPLGRSGRVLGSDFAGVVVGFGDHVEATDRLKIGARVAGFLQGACSVNDRPGAFAEYLVCPWDLVWHINDLSFEEAATISLCALTAAQALYLRLGLPAPFAPVKRFDSSTSMSLVINGATASVALYAAQLAHASPTTVDIFGTASPKHFPLLNQKPYNYRHLANYRDADWAPDIVSHRGGLLDAGFDCISEGTTVLNTAKTLRKGASLAVVRSRQGKAWKTSAAELGLEPQYGAVWEGLGEDVEYVGMSLPANKEMRAFTGCFYTWLSSGGMIVPNPVRLMPGGLDKVFEDGFALMGSGTMDDRQGGRTEDWMKPVSAEVCSFHLVSNLLCVCARLVADQLLRHYGLHFSLQSKMGCRA
jgi:NADPH:quinone reductase-like Zn-dependent oxidoreductase